MELHNTYATSRRPGERPITAQSRKPVRLPPSTSTNRLPRCGSPCTNVRGPRFQSFTISGGVGEIQVGDPVERLVELVAECLDGHGHELRAAARVAGALVRHPVEVAPVGEARRLPVLRVQARQLLDDVERAERNVVVGRLREPASGRFEILEHHHVPVALGLRVPNARYADGNFVREVAVEARFGHAHPGGGDELALAFVERRELDEDRCRHARRGP